MTVTVSSAPAGTITVQPGDRTPASIVIKNYNIENVTTSEIPEGGNLYFSNARAVAALTAGQSITSMQTVGLTHLQQVVLTIPIPILTQMLA